MVLPSQIKTFSDALAIAMSKAGVTDAQPENVENMKSAMGQWYDSIVTERDWHWRIFSRSFTISPPITTGTISIQNGSRIIDFTGLTISRDHLSRSIRINGGDELYRIIGINTSTNEAYLDAYYVGDDDADATYIMYQYEFSLPPDCDNIVSAFVSGRNEIEPRSPADFSRLVTYRSYDEDFPYVYSRYGLNLNPDNLVPPLGEWILAYDFLAADDNSGKMGDRFSIFPIATNTMCKIDIDYSMHSAGYEADAIPLLPITDRWMLVNYALYEYYRDNGKFQLASSHLSTVNKRLKEMRSEYKHSDGRPRLVFDGRGPHRDSIVGGNRKYPRINNWESG